jgi:hypothetical protein
VSREVKVSIVTPVLNGARFLSELITCIEAQTHGDWEHIIVDGGSTDASLQIARDWTARDERALLIEAPGLGLYPSIFRGFDQSSGDMLAWLASDDLYTRWAFDCVVEHAERTGARWMTGFPGAWDESGRLRYVRPYGRYPRTWIRKGWFHTGFLGHLQQESMFFSRDLFEKVPKAQRDEIEVMRLAGDFQLWRRLAEHAPLSVLPTALAGFRFHGQNLSVGGADTYADEVRATGAPFPHPRLARLMESAFRKWSALGAIDIMREADGILFRSMDPIRIQAVKDATPRV